MDEVAPVSPAGLHYLRNRLECLPPRLGWQRSQEVLEIGLVLFSIGQQLHRDQVSSTHNRQRQVTPPLEARRSDNLVLDAAEGDQQIDKNPGGRVMHSNRRQGSIVLVDEHCINPKSRTLKGVHQALGGCVVNRDGEINIERCSRHCPDAEGNASY